MYALSLAVLMPIAMFSSYKMMMGNKSALNDVRLRRQFHRALNDAPFR
jgi:hypothetical protein